MRRSEQRCRRHSWMRDGVGEWQPVGPEERLGESWKVYKPCSWDGRRLVALAGRYMTYGGGTIYNKDGTKSDYSERGYVDVQLGHP